MQKNREKIFKKIQSQKQSKNSSAKKSKISKSETNSFESKIIPGLKFELSLLKEDNKFEIISFEKSFQHLGEVQLNKEMVSFLIFYFISEIKTIQFFNILEKKPQ